MKQTVGYTFPKGGTIEVHAADEHMPAAHAIDEGGEAYAVCDQVAAALEEVTDPEIAPEDEATVGLGARLAGFLGGSKTPETPED